MKLNFLDTKIGPKTLVIENQGSQSGSVQIWFRAGSALEKPSDFGIAHFLEHMFFKGTPTYPGPQLTKEIESFGGEVNAFTSFDYTCYYINAPKKYIYKATEILLDMVSHPLFTNSDLLTEREVVFEEYLRSEDSPQQFSFKKIQQNSFMSGYQHPIIGEVKTIKKFSQQQIIKFRKNHYNNNNALLIIAGSTPNSAKLLKLIDQYKLPSGPVAKFPKFQLQKKPTINVHQKEVRMLTLTLTIEGSPYLSKKSCSEDLAVNCLGHGESSLLYKKLVLETALSNHSSASTMYMNHGGVHFFRVNFPVNNREKVYSVLTETIINMVEVGPTASDVEKIKSQYIASKVYEKESIESYAFTMGHGFAQNGDIYCESKFVEMLKVISVEEVHQSLIEIFTRAIHLNLQITEKDEIQKEKKQLEKFKVQLNKSIKNSLIKIQNKKRKPNLSITKSQFDSQLNLVKLESGVSLLHRLNEQTPTFIFNAYIVGGLIDETEKNMGLHHLLCSTLTKGHSKCSLEDLKLLLEEKSASLSGFAGKNTYGLNLHGQSKNLDELLFHFFNSLTGPLFDEKQLKNEISITARVIESQKEDAAKICFKEVSRILFPNHPYKLEILGDLKSLKNINQSLLKKTHLNNLANKEILLTYCGDMPLNELVLKLSPLIAELKNRNKIISQKNSKKVNEFKLSKNHFTHIPFKREQTHIFVGFSGYSHNQKENIPLKIFHAFLSGQSSDLFVNMRDKQGLCYVVQSVLMIGISAGYWGIYMASSNDKAQKAYESILKILEDLKTNGIALKDFNRVKKMMEGQNQLQLQTNDDFADTYSLPQIHGEGMDFYHKSNLAVQKLSHASFQKFIKSFLAQHHISVIVGKNVKE